MAHERARQFWWALQDLNLGPTDYESHNPSLGTPVNTEGFGV
jgi:hypothetical protein